MEHLFVRTMLNTEIAYKLIDHLPHWTIMIGFSLYLWRQFGIELNQKSTLQYEKLVKLLLGF